MLNLDLSFASWNDLASWVWNKPWAVCPLLRVLRLEGHCTALERKSCSLEAMSWRCLIALVRVAILVVALSVSAISLAVSVKIEGVFLLELRSKAAKRIWNLAQRILD